MYEPIASEYEVPQKILSEGSVSTLKTTEDNLYSETEFPVVDTVSNAMYCADNISQTNFSEKVNGIPFLYDS